LKSVGNIFTKLSALVHFWDKDEHTELLGKKVHGHKGQKMPENALFGLVNRIS